MNICLAPPPSRKKHPAPAENLFVEISARFCEHSTRRRARCGAPKKTKTGNPLKNNVRKNF